MSSATLSVTRASFRGGTRDRAAPILHPLLVRALTTDDVAELEDYIDRHLAQLKDPYEGEPLAADWRSTLGNGDVHEYGDYALTQFYDPADCSGIGYEWARLSDELLDPAANAMLGFSVGPAENRFDPGRYGSYFQTPRQARESLAALGRLGRSELARYLALLEHCVAKQRGVYLTF